MAYSLAYDKFFEEAVNTSMGRFMSLVVVWEGFCRNMNIKKKTLRRIKLV